jgi:hypothetical protein
MDAVRGREIERERDVDEVGVLGRRRVRIGGVSRAWADTRQSGQAASHWCQPLPGILGGGRALLVAIAARAHGGARPAWGVPPRLVDEQELSRDMGVAEWEWEWEGWDWDDGRDIGCFVLLRPD